MSENKKGKFFKGLLKQDKNKEQEEAEQIAQETETVAETHAEQPSAEWVLDDNASERNRIDMIYRLYSRWCEKTGELPTDILFSKWMREPITELEQQEIEEKAQREAEQQENEGQEGDEKQDAEEERDFRVPIPSTDPFHRQLSSAASKIIKKIEAEEKKAEKEEEKRRKNPDQAVDAEPINPIPDIDAEVHLYMPKGNMCALICAFPPIGNGKPLDQETVNEALEKAKIIYGIDQELAEKIVAEKQFFKIFRIALGDPAIPGKDGEIIEHIPRQEFLTFEEDETGRVNYKDLNLFRNIEKGELICDIIAPEEGQDGMDIKGNVLKGKDGTAPRVPAGSHTVITPDGSRLVAEQDGYISFQSEKFRVENRLVINGDVDMSVGNQDFLGDIFIQGDVFSGFTIKATGNVFISGLVEGAEIIAGENISIGSGMNGNNRGTLHAGDSVQSSFLENAKVYANGNVNTKSMVSCDVYCDGSIDVSQGAGILVGGAITAGKSVTAKIIGSKAYRKTELYLGVMPETKTKRDQKELELKSIKNTRENLQKNIHFLQSAESLTPEKEQVLKQIIEQETLYSKIQQRLTAEIEVLNEEINDYRGCFVRASQVYPPAKITIGGASYNLETTTMKCKFYLSELGEVILGVD